MSTLISPSRLVKGMFTRRLVTKLIRLFCSSSANTLAIEQEIYSLIAAVTIAFIADQVNIPWVITSVVSAHSCFCSSSKYSISMSTSKNCLNFSLLQPSKAYIHALMISASWKGISFDARAIWLDDWFGAQSCLMKWSGSSYQDIVFKLVQVDRSNDIPIFFC